MVATAIRKTRGRASMRSRRTWGLGPVFGFECLTVPRRWQVFAGRALLVSAMLATMWMLWAPEGETFTTIGELSEFGSRLFQALIIIQISVVLLVAPVATAGSICVDKSRGTLYHVFVTDLTDREIVLGKLGARLLSLVTLMTCGVPVLAIGGLLGGVPQVAIVAAFLVTFGVAVFASCLAMVLSVWFRKPHQALLTTYVVLGTWLAFFPVLNRYQLGPDPGSPLLLASPFVMALSPYLPGGDEPSLIPPTIFLLVMILVSSLLVMVTIKKLRPVAIRQMDRPQKRERIERPNLLPNLRPGPSMDANPILWREWHRKKGAKWTRRFWTAYVGLSSVLALYVVSSYFELKLNGDHLAGIVNGWAVAIGLLLLTISATTSLAEERDRGSLDVIMTTPLSTRAILWGKWWGTFAMVPRLAILPVWISLNLAIVGANYLDTLLTIAQILAMAAAVTSMGFAIATWVPRLGRAIAAGVVIYAVGSLGIVMFHYAMVNRVKPPPPMRRFTFNQMGPTGVMTTVTYYARPQPWSINEPPPPEHDFLLLANPYYAISESTMWAGRRDGVNQSVYYSNPGDAYKLGQNEGRGWAVMWVIVYAGISLVLMTMVIATFDRCLGRITLKKSLVNALGMKELRISRLKTEGNRLSW